MSETHRLCRISELLPGERKIVELAGKSIGIFNVGGTFYALRNICPHQFAPLCEGRITGFAQPSAVGEYQWARAGEIIRCPWHGWEFDIRTGRSIFNPNRVRIQSLPVTVETQEPEVETYPVEAGDGWVVVHV